MEIHPVHAGLFKLDGGAMFGVVPKTLWEKKHAPDPNNLCTWAMRCMLVVDGERVMLIDNGLGDKQDEKFFSHYEPHGDQTLRASLKAHGLSVDDITDVFLTHLHFDHCGGSIRWNAARDGFEPVFKNATYWSNQDHWNWAVRPNDREKASFLKENILPIEESGRLKHIVVPDRKDTEPFLVHEAFPNMDVWCVHGHTDAMMIPHIRYKGHTVVFMADLLPSVHHIPVAWVMAYDTRPLLTLAEKRSFLERAADERYVLFFEHDRDHECATVMRTEKGIRLERTFPLSELG